jgi:3-hydroxyacyl-CoA dehydrogenase
MKWGFGWRFGPFEIWDMIGFSSSIERMTADKKSIPEWIKKIKHKRGSVFY